MLLREEPVWLFQSLILSLNLKVKKNKKNNPRFKNKKLLFKLIFKELQIQTINKFKGTGFKTHLTI